MPAVPPSEQDLLQPSGEADWEHWLAAHHAEATEAWLKLGRKGCPHPSITHAQALDVALCFGWIDAQVRSHDAHFTLRRFTPRRPKSKWSQINRDNVARLVAAGRMRPAGQAQIDAARADGRWDAAYAPPSTIVVPDDLQRALGEHPGAAAFFATLSGDDRYAYLYRLHHVADPARRTARIEDYVARLAAGRTLTDTD